MSDKKYPPGAIISADITSSKADELKQFYSQVVGWQTEEMKMSDEKGEYADYVLKDKQGNQVGGICHKRGVNNDLPAQWIVYVNVDDIKQSVDKCIELGGKVLKEQKGEDGVYYYALIEDPAKGIIALTKI